jgi:cellulose synthase/poly-beta-1,6-N-acetylglucosamine synthase-like glycosyltransferase
MIDRVPQLSVIVPVRNGVSVLPRSLGALLESDLERARWELIVVDDASTDDSARVADWYADLVLQLPERALGPAYARNRGCDVARGEIVVFVDADVCVHRDTLRRFADLFDDATIGAAFGSYDTRPPAAGLVSQYRNLLHHYVHQQNAGDAETFWAGCGAVRRSAFVEADMFDEWHFPRPQIEDIELGGRIRALGHRIILAPEIQGTHLKRWTLTGMIRTDLFDRGVPWTRLLVQRSAALRAGSLNLQPIEKIKTALVCLACLLVALAAVTVDARWLMGAGFALLAVLASSYDVYAFFLRARGWRFAFAVVPLNLMYYALNGVSATFGWLLHHLVGEPRPDPVIEAFSEVGMVRHPPLPTRRRGDAWERWACSPE